MSRDLLNFQYHIANWMRKVFSKEVIMDKQERCDRFLEEALELCQAFGYTRERAGAIAQYVFSRPVGEPAQEVGGVMVTLGALCQTAGISLNSAAWDEMSRVEQPEVIAKIQAKQASKPTGSNLPYPEPYSPLPLNEDTRKILGLMVMWTGPFCRVLRANGWEIPKKIEEEQAVVLHWLLNIYFQHGSKWKDVAGVEIDKMVAIAKEKEKARESKKEDAKGKGSAGVGEAPNSSS